MFNLLEARVQPVRRLEEQRYQKLMQTHHYLGALPKISETLWYVATFADQGIALLSFSAAALKCSVRDRWIGWDFRHQYDRLKLVTNNSRFLILPDWHFPNLASRILSLCHNRLAADWQAVFGHPVVLLETFVDPQRFQGTIYKAANWIYVGNTKGFHRTRQGYSATAKSPKMVFVKPLISDAQALLSRLILKPAYRTEGPKIMLSAQQMETLPDFVHCDPPDHGRIEIRKIWTTTELNDYLNFPHVGQAFVIQRESTDKKTAKYSCDIAYGITSRTAEQADPQGVLDTNRGHWSIENCCHYIIDSSNLRSKIAL